MGFFWWGVLWLVTGFVAGYVTAIFIAAWNYREEGRRTGLNEGFQMMMEAAVNRGHAKWIFKPNGSCKPSVDFEWLDPVALTPQEPT